MFCTLQVIWKRKAQHLISNLGWWQILGILSGAHPCTRMCCISFTSGLPDEVKRKEIYLKPVWGADTFLRISLMHFSLLRLVDNTDVCWYKRRHVLGNLSERKLLKGSVDNVLQSFTVILGLLQWIWEKNSETCGWTGSPEVLLFFCPWLGWGLCVGNFDCIFTCSTIVQKLYTATWQMTKCQWRVEILIRRVISFCGVYDAFHQAFLIVWSIRSNPSLNRLQTLDLWWKSLGSQVM